MRSEKSQLTLVQHARASGDVGGLQMVADLIAQAGVAASPTAATGDMLKGKAASKGKGPSKGKGVSKGKAVKNNAERVILEPTASKSKIPIAMDVSNLVRFGEPTWGWERSRFQIMARTGFRGPGQSVKFRWKGTGSNYRDEKTAQAAADAWIVAERKRQRLDA